jgi:uncharacterized protein YwgA
MNRGRIAKMTENVVGTVTAEEIDNVRVAAVAEDEDALAMVEQAIDAMIASSQIIDENLSKIRIESVPQQAAVDIVKDLMQNAIEPYLADVVLAMKNLGE